MEPQMRRKGELSVIYDIVEAQLQSWYHKGYCKIFMVALQYQKRIALELHYS